MQWVWSCILEEGVRESWEAPSSSSSSILINVNFIVPVPGRCSPKMCVRNMVAFWIQFQTSKEFRDKAVFINLRRVDRTNFYPRALLTSNVCQLRDDRAGLFVKQDAGKLKMWQEFTVKQHSELRQRWNVSLQMRKKSCLVTFLNRWYVSHQSAHMDLSQKE